MEHERAERLVAQYTDTLLRIGYTWLGDLDDAKDICQIALIRAWEADKTFPSPEEERAWIIRVGINACRDWKKSAWFRHRASLDETLSLTVEPPEEGGLLELVQSLPLKYRRVIYLHYYEGYEVKEIAKLLGKKAELVSNHLSRARIKLRALWKEEQDGTIPE